MFHNPVAESTLPQYEVYAIKFGTNPAHRSKHSFLKGDDHDHPMPLDYFVWVIKGESRVFVLDTGFDEDVARQRNRTLFRSPADGLKLLGIDPDAVEDVIISHMHYDHCGNHGLFPRARFHLQDREMAYCTGRCMCHPMMRGAFDAEDVAAMVRKVFAGRVRFHDGVHELAPGVVLHHVGGHTAGIQVVRVWTRRGWVVLASDVTHFYANFETHCPIPVLDKVGEAFEGFDTLRALAGGVHAIIPGHDPLVLERYPAPSRALEGIVARLDLEPAVGAFSGTVVSANAS